MRRSEKIVGRKELEIRSSVTVENKKLKEENVILKFLLTMYKKELTHQSTTIQAALNRYDE